MHFEFLRFKLFYKETNYFELHRQVALFHLNPPEYILAEAQWLIHKYNQTSKGTLHKVFKIKHHEASANINKAPQIVV